MKNVFRLLLLLLMSVNISCESEPTPTCTDGIQNGSEQGIDCGGICSSCQSSENDILDIEFTPSPTGFDPLITINNEDHFVKIAVGKVFPTKNLTELPMTITTSDGAIVLNQPLDFSEPTIVTVEAEDGAEQDYAFLVSQAYGSHTQEFSSGSTLTEEVRGVYRSISTSDENGRVEMRFAPETSIADGEYYVFTVFLEGLTFQNDLVGSYNLQASNEETFCAFTFPTSSGGLSTLLTPVKGKFIITEHDQINSTVTGIIDQLEYNPPVGSSIRHFAYLEFTNISYN